MLNKIKNLKDKLARYNTIELLGYISTKFMTFAADGEDIAKASNIFNKVKLDSPHKQLLYLAGLLMSTDYIAETVKEDEANKEIDMDEKYSDLISSVKEITDGYIANFIPFEMSIKERLSMSKIEKTKRLVTMQAFTSYFNTDTLRYEEQIIQRITNYISPFDDKLKEHKGFVTKDIINFYHLVRETVINSMNETRNSWTTMFDDYEKLMNRLEKIQDVEQRYNMMLNAGQEMREKHNLESIHNLFVLHQSDVYNKFGVEVGESILSLVTLERKEREFFYYNTNNPFEEKPLCSITNDSYFIVHPKIVLSALYEKLVCILEQMHKDNIIRFYYHRGHIAEKRTFELFHTVFQDKAKYFKSVCEVPKTDEHDLLIIYKDKLLIIEVKSSKVKEPLFNPDKAYIRIKDHFNSKKGIGGGYTQATKLSDFINSKQETTLYHDMTEEFTIKKEDFSKVYKIVITLEQFGLFNVNMSSILDKKNEDPYPWSCNLYDFENLLEMYTYINSTPDNFIKYLEWRIDNHKKILSTDELDIYEVYNTRSDITEIENTIFIPSLDYSLIDKIYYENHGVDYYHPHFPGHKKKKKIGRNDPCPCGSGKKYKRCCLNK